MRSIMLLALALVVLGLPAAAQVSQRPQESQMPEESQTPHPMPEPSEAAPQSERPRLPELHRMPADWEPASRLNSASLAAAGMEHTGTAGLSLPDGRQAVVTFWSAAVIGVLGQTLAFRCVTVFDPELIESGETCEQAEHREE